MPLTTVPSGNKTANDPITILPHGDSKVGKTTFASTFPEPLIGDLENGSQFLTRNVDTVPWIAKNFTEIMEDMDLVCAENHKYKTFVVDSMDWLERKIEEDVCQANGVATLNEIQWGKGRGLAMLRLSKFLEKCAYLRDQKKMNLVFLCHSQIKRIEDPIYPSYDRWGLKMNDKSSALMTEWVDIIGYLHFKQEIQKEEGNWGKSTSKAVGGEQRILSCAHRPAYLAGNRLSLPDELEPTYDALKSAIEQVLN